MPALTTIEIGNGVFNSGDCDGNLVLSSVLAGGA